MPYAEVEGARLHIQQQGTGPVALFVHGFPLDSSMWIQQLDALADMRRCVAVDLRGFGRSDPVTGEPLTMDQHADDLVAVLDLISVEQADLVGFSMGGYAALAFAESYSHRLRSLALVDTRAGADSEEGKLGRDAMALRLVQDGRVAIAEALQDGLLGPDASILARARLRSMIEGCRYETIVAALSGMRDREDRTEALSTVKVPTAVIVGEQDAVTPVSESEIMASAIQDATMTVISGSGHMTPIEQPVATNAALRALLERVDPGVV